MADFGAMLHGAMGVIVLIFLTIPTVLLSTSQVKYKSTVQFCVLTSLILSIVAIAVGDLTYIVYRNKKDSTSARWVIKRGTVTYTCPKVDEESGQDIEGETESRIVKTGTELAWVHAMGMEMKEHIAHFLPPVLLVVLALLGLYKENETLNRRIEIASCGLLICTTIWLLIVIAWGALITKTAVM